jgi:hypothetical protein
MIYISKKLVVVIALLLVLTAGLLIIKSHFYNRIPKSAKLVFMLKV